mgnify:CR=1 FL=1
MEQTTPNSTKTMANLILKRSLNLINDVIRHYKIKPTTAMLCQVEDTLINMEKIILEVQSETDAAEPALFAINKMLDVIQTSTPAATEINEITLTQA